MGESCIKSPSCLPNKKNVINHPNKDDECFTYGLITSLGHSKPYGKNYK